MFEHYFFRFSGFLNKNRKKVIWSVIVMSIAAWTAAAFVGFDSSMDLIFPRDPNIRRSIDFLRDSNLSDKVVISLGLTDPEKGKTDLFQAADRLAGLLTPPLFTRVTKGLPPQLMQADFSIMQYAPLLLGEADLKRIDARLTPAGISEQMRNIRLGAMKLESVFTSQLVRSDPVGVRELLFAKIQAVPASMGYDVSVEDGHFVSRDGRHAMLIAETPVKMTDSAGSRELVAALDRHTRSLPGFITADIISGHVHMVSNENVVRRDIRIASALATVSFLLFFLFVFPDHRIIQVFLIPVVAIALSILAATAFAGRLSYLVIGIGTAVAGITVDHGLHMYIALRKKATPSQAMHVSRLIAIDGITTAFGFGALFLSGVEGYHQLAFFAILCVVFSLFLSIFILPLTLSWPGAQPEAQQREERLFGSFRSRPAYVAVWALLSVAALFFSANIRLETDIMHLDGSDAGVREAEERFYRTWGGQDKQAVFVATGPSLEEALQRNDGVYRDAVAAAGENNFISLSAIWPSEKTRQENRETWSRFWREGRADRLRRLISEQASQYRIREQAFAPFFEGLDRDAADRPVPGPFLQKLSERFIVQKDGEFRVLSFFRDDDRLINALTPVAERHEGSFIVSRKAVSRAVSSFTIGEVRLLVPVALLLNIVLTWFFFRNAREMFIALVPLLTGVIWLTCCMAVLEVPLDVVSVIGLVVVSGVIVDYGIGVTYEYQYRLNIGTMAAVSLSAITTVLGSGVLLFADHPVIFSIGIAMTVSVLAGYLTSVFVVPSLCDLFAKARKRETVQ